MPMSLCSLLSLLQMQLLSPLTPTSPAALEIPFLGVTGTQPLSQEAHPGRLGQVQGWAGSWGGMGGVISGAVAPRTSVYL